MKSERTSKSIGGAAARKAFWVLLIAAPIICVACRKEGAQGGPPPGNPEVSVITVQPQSVTLTTELPGRTSAYMIAEVRPQISGLVQKRLFTEGADVAAGSVLYQIDPAPFQVALDNAEANLSAARRAADRAQAAYQASLANIAQQQATLELANANRRRIESLVKNGAVSMSDRDQAVTNAKVAEATLGSARAQANNAKAAIAEADAAIEQAQAAVKKAGIDLGYTRITAPIAGRIGKSNVTVGALATAYQAGAFTTIQQLDPIYIDVQQSTSELQQLQRRLDKGILTKDGGNQKMVKIMLDNDRLYPLEGTLQFHDVTVDPSTGAVLLRVIVPNPKGVLLPGMFVKAVIEEGINDKAILVPQQAVSRNSKGNPQVLIVEASGTVRQKMLVLEKTIGDKWLVSSGLAPGDRVIVEGMQKARVGEPAKALPFAGKPGNQPVVSTQPPQQSK